MKLLFLIPCVFSALLACAQSKLVPSVQQLTSGVNTSLRGLSVVNDQVVWVSGSNGTVGHTSNGGKDWKWINVKGFEHSDFRDIEAFDGATALTLSVGEPAYILRTVAAGETW